jgi:MYXO-CTERM domain-containing protein
VQVEIDRPDWLDMKKLCAIALIALAATADAQTQPVAMNAAASAAAIPATPQARGIPVSSASSAPEPAIAWVLALGFLGLVVLRRTRHALSF